MSTAAKAFLTGFMGEAAKQIKDENERLENYALTRANQLIKEMDEFDEEQKKVTSELKQQARDLSTYIAGANPELTRAQVEQRVSGILLKGQGKRVIDMFESAQKGGKVTKQMADVFKPSADVDEKATGILQETIGKLTTGVKMPGRGTGVMPQRGAFGLPSGIYKDTMQQAAATQGLTLDEFAAKRLPSIEEVGEPPAGTFDVNVFAEETDAPTKEKILAEFAEKIYEAGTQEEKQALIKERDSYLAGFPKDDKDKALTFSNAMTGFRTAVEQAVNRNTTKLGGAEYIVKDGSITFRGTADQQKVFNQIKADALREASSRYADSRGAVPEEIASALNFYGVKVGKDNVPVFERGAEGGGAPGAVPSKATVTSRNGKFYVVKDGKEILEVDTRQKALEAIKDMGL